MLNIINMENKSQDIYVSSFRRASAAAIDILVVAFLRILFAQINGILWFNDQVLKFTDEFKNKFGTEIIGRSPEHIEFLIHHSIVKSTIVFYIMIVLVGAFYHALLNSSSWCATLGKRIMNIILVKNEGKRMSILNGFGHYFLSIVPWIFMIYIMIYQSYHGTTIYESISGNIFNLIFGIISATWININFITKKKITIQDIVMGTTMADGKIGGSYPSWSGTK